jgi:hypothetical protein
MEQVYKDYSPACERELAVLLGQITHHVYPDIISNIEASNVKFKDDFLSICDSNTPIESFFYDRSDCLFPSYRRPVNREKEQDRWKNVKQADGTILNDDTTPRHIWAFLEQGRAYSGGTKGMWQSSGLGQFELAHVFGHKQDERQLERAVFHTVSDTEPYGLFSSASNVVLTPKGYAKPTDHMKSLKLCFYQRHFDLYGNNMIGLKGFKRDLVPPWYSEIEWLEPALPENWRLKVELLLRFRYKH